MKPLKLRPLSGYILIEALDEQETTASGLVMPEKAKEKPEKGKVVAIGDPIIHFETNNLYEEFAPVKVGDKTIFHRWSGQDVKEGQKEYKLVKFADLLGIYE